MDSASAKVFAAGEKLVRRKRVAPLCGVPSHVRVTFVSTGQTENPGTIAVPGFSLSFRRSFPFIYLQRSFPMDLSIRRALSPRIRPAAWHTESRAFLIALSGGSTQAEGESRRKSILDAVARAAPPVKSGAIFRFSALQTKAGTPAAAMAAGVPVLELGVNGVFPGYLNYFLPSSFSSPASGAAGLGSSTPRISTS